MKRLRVDFHCCIIIFPWACAENVIHQWNQQRQCFKGFGNIKSMNNVQLSHLRAKFHTLPLVYSIWNAPIFTLWLIWWLRKINERNKFSANYNNHDKVSKVIFFFKKNLFAPINLCLRQWKSTGAFKDKLKKSTLRYSPPLFMVVGGLAYTGDVESGPRWYAESLAQVKAQWRKTAYMIFYKSTITRFVRDFNNSSIFVPLSISVYINFGLAVFLF